MSVVQKKDLTGAVLGLGAWPQVQHHDSARPLLPHRLVEPCTQKFPKAPLHGGNDRARTASHAQPLRPRTCRRQSRWHHRTRRLRSGRRGPCNKERSRMLLALLCRNMRRLWLSSAQICGEHAALAGSLAGVALATAPAMLAAQARACPHSPRLTGLSSRAVADRMRRWKNEGR